MQEIKTIQYVKGILLLSALLTGALALWVLAGWGIYKFIRWVGVW
jgi:hypothetical protein